MAKPTPFGIIVKKYRIIRRDNTDTQFLHCIAQDNLADAIAVAARSIDANDRIHGHQHRIGRKKLNAFAASLSSGLHQIQVATTFQEIYDIVKAYRTDKIGELAIYDTSHRIGAFRGIYPDEVYLHSGTLIGARKIFGTLKGRKTLKLSDFSPTIQQEHLTAQEMEDVLCIFKNSMHSGL